LIQKNLFNKLYDRSFNEGVFMPSNDIQLQSPIGNILGKLCALSAGFGGVFLVALALMTLASVIGRAFFAHPIQGDVELVQLGCAVCVASFLPYTQYKKANIIVDFFTANASEKTQAWMDGLGTLILTISMGLITWRLSLGGLRIKENGETSMLMAIPVWIPYFLMLPGLALTTIVGAYQTTQNFSIAFFNARSST
jgi:TRAP-type C4-dicarboxylate transport system permease small subunit